MVPVVEDLISPKQLTELNAELDQHLQNVHRD